MCNPSSMAPIKWPRLLTPTHLSHFIRLQKNPLTALDLFNTAPLIFPSYHHNSLVYASIITSLTTPNLHLPQLTSLLSQMLHDSPPCRDHILARTIDALAISNPTHALNLFHLIPISNCPSWTSSFHSILTLLISQHNLELAHHLLVEATRICSVRVSVRTLNLLMEAMCRAGRTDLAMEIFGEIREQCEYPDRETYRILMRGLCRDGRLEDATHLLYSMLWRISQKGCEADVIVYRTLLKALCAEGRIGDAEEILGKVLKKGLRTPRRRRLFRRPEIEGGGLEETKRMIDESLVVGGVRSLASYGAMIGDLYGEGRFGDADRMFDEMFEKGFRPTVMMYETKIEALCGVGRAEDGARVLEVEMKERDCVPGVRTYNLVMGGLCKEGKVARAASYLARMDKQVGCVAGRETFEILVNGFCSEGRFLEAAGMLERMVRSRCWPKAAIFDSVIQGLCSIRRRYEALLWLEEMVSQGNAPEIGLWSSLVSLVCSDSAGNSHVEMAWYMS